MYNRAMARFNNHQTTSNHLKQPQTKRAERLAEDQSGSLAEDRSVRRQD